MLILALQSQLFDFPLKVSDALALLGPNSFLQSGESPILLFDVVTHLDELVLLLIQLVFEQRNLLLRFFQVAAVFIY